MGSRLLPLVSSSHEYPSGILKGVPCFCFRFILVSERPVGIVSMYWGRFIPCWGTGEILASHGQNLCEQTWLCFCLAVAEGWVVWWTVHEGSSALQKGCLKGRLSQQQPPEGFTYLPCLCPSPWASRRCRCGRLHGNRKSERWDRLSRAGGVGIRKEAQQEAPDPMVLPSVTRVKQLLPFIYLFTKGQCQSNAWQKVWRVAG